LSEPYSFTLEGTSDCHSAGRAFFGFVEILPMIDDVTPPIREVLTSTIGIPDRPAAGE